MTTSMFLSLTTTPSSLSVSFNPQFRPSCPSISVQNPKTLRFPLCRAAKQQSGPVKKPPANKKKKKKDGGGGGGGGGGGRGFSGGGSGGSRVLTLDDVEIVDDGDWDDWEMDERGRGSEPYQPLPMPKPPAGFILDEQGRPCMVSNKRLATIVDSDNNSPLECIIRRVFRSSRGDECMLLCPVDTPVDVMKSTNLDGFSQVSAEEFKAILPTIEYELAKIHMHLVHSGFCYTARGGFCYIEEDIFKLCPGVEGEDIGAISEGIEITCFHVDGSHYMLFTPSDPILFVAVKDQNGQLKIADDDLMEDPAIASALDEETEFNALVEEEAALLNSLIGKTMSGL